jgi:predicted dehydrogenase
MDAGCSRREFLKRAGIFGACIWLGAKPGFARTYQANEKLNIGVIGVANRGRDNLAGVSSENIVALCDIDETFLARAKTNYPDAAVFTDFRKMIETRGLDAVVISTADHTHAPASAMALRSRLHVYCEKPLTHTVYEARQLTKLAKETKRATQLGTQIHAGDNYRRVVEVIQSQAIGAVEEVHVWCAGGYSGGERPAETQEVPSTLHWDLWLGPAPERPYHSAYIPHRWRGWWDFGNGTLGDLACHHVDLPFWALNLRYPETVEAEGPPVHPESCPVWLIVRYTFPARENLPPVKLTWYNGDRRPPHFAEGLLPEWGNGTLFVGSKGMLLADYNRYVLLPQKQFEGFTPPPKTIPDSIGHYAEWIQACKSGSPTTCNFDYSGALTEAVLLGNVAYRSGEKLHWDGSRFKLKNASRAEGFLHKKYRKGWKL